MQIVEGKKYYKTRKFENLREMLIQSVELFGERDAFVFRDTPNSQVKRKTYKEYYNDVTAFGASIMKAGLKDKKTAIIGENSYPWCVAYMATVCGIGTVVPLDKLLPEEEILTLLERGDVGAVVYDASFHNTMRKAASKFSGIEKFVALNTFKFDKLPEEFNKNDDLSDDGLERFIAEETFLEKGIEILKNNDTSVCDLTIDPDATMALLFTSGTTSKSKAVMLSHKNVCEDIKGLAGVVRIKPGTKLLSVLPLHHTFENTCGFLAALYYGMVIHECDGLRYIQKNMQEYKINCIIAVPLLFQSFYTKIKQGVSKQGKEATLSKGIKISDILRKFGIDIRKKLFKDILGKFGGEFNFGICGAAPIDPEIIKFFDSIGVRILQGYGLTETSPVVAGCNSKVFMPGTVGHPLSGVQLAVDSKTPGQEGEILVRGNVVMKGYYKDENATEEAIDSNGWFHTGDIGRIDPKNKCLSITGRMKSMIVLKNGKKVFPEEIEHILGQFDFIKESMVWGEARETGDVDVWAKVVLDKDILESRGEDIEDEENVKKKLDSLFKEINRKLPAYKSVNYYIYGEDDMEKTTTRKIKRNIELDSIRGIIQKNKIRIKQAAGKNIDTLKKIVSSNPKKNNNENRDE